MRNKQNKLVKATQIAFELEQKIAIDIRTLAANQGLTASDQLRKLIGLSYSSPKRPRLSISLTSNDYKLLGKRYNLDTTNTIEIKKKIVSELIKYFD